SWSTRPAPASRDRAFAVRRRSRPAAVATVEAEAGPEPRTRAATVRSRSSSASRPRRVEASELMVGDQAIGPLIGSGPPPGRPGVARCPFMESDRRTFLRSLVAGGVLAGGGFGRAARAFVGGSPELRIAVLPVRAARPSAFPGAGAGLIKLGTLRLPFPATHLGLRWRGNEADLVEICWQVAGEWGG